MKTQNFCFPAIFQPSFKTINRRVISGAVRSTVMALTVVAFLLMNGCATEKPASLVKCVAPPLAADLRFQLGTVALVHDPKPAAFSFQKAAGQIDYASDRAGAAAGKMLATTTSD